MNAAAILQFHDSCLARSSWPHAESEPLTPAAWCWVHANHRYNSLLRQAPLARRARACYRQRRQYTIAALDQALHPGAGKLINALSLLALARCQQRAGLAGRLDRLLMLTQINS